MKSGNILSQLGAEVAARLVPYLVRVECRSGDVIVHEGEAATAMFIVHEGEARVTRAELDLGRLGPGDHFGELALMSRRPRAATIIAETAVSLSRLDASAFDTMLQNDPILATQLTRAIVSSLGEQLTDMTDSVGMLLRERSLPRRTSVVVTVGGEKRTIRTGTRISSLLPREHDGAPVVAALLDSKAVPLGQPLTADAIVEPLTTSHWEGERIVRQSVSLALLEAVRRVDPHLVAEMGPSLGAARWFSLSRSDQAAIDLIDVGARLRTVMADIIEKDLVFEHEWWTVEEAVAHFREVGIPHVADLLNTRRERMVSLVRCGHVHVLEMGPTVPSASYLRGCSIEMNDGGFVVLSGSNATLPLRGSRWAEVMEAHEKWLGSLGVHSVGTFNRMCIDGNVKEVIRVAEGFHEKRLGRLADTIGDRSGQVRVVCVAGPSSSGKTTFMKRLRVQLQVVGLRPVEISLDDYYLDRAKVPRDAEGQLDFELLEALDLENFRAHMRRLLAGETVRLARFDFRTGKSDSEGGREVTLDTGTILLVEGIHGLSPRLFGDAIPRERLFRLFIQPMTSLPFDQMSRLNPSDLRLLRRIVRDRHARGTSTEDNIMRWSSVRRGEKKHIFPTIGEADAIFDTSLVYEVSVLKTYAERYLLEVPAGSPAFATAERLRHLIDQFVAIREAHVPATSILREFIGESGFEY